MAVQGVDRAAEVAQAQRSERAQQARAENEKRRAEAESARQEQQAARDANRGNGVEGLKKKSRPLREAYGEAGRVRVVTHPFFFLRPQSRSRRIIILLFNV